MKLFKDALIYDGTGSEAFNGDILIDNDRIVKVEADIKPEEGEWEETEAYLLPQLKALVGRFSKLGDEAFYRFYLPIDDTIQAALKNSSIVD